MIHGNIVRAAKWLAGGMVGAALVCVIGFHPMVTGRVVKIEPAATEPAKARDGERIPVPPREIITDPPRSHDRTWTTYRSR